MRAATLALVTEIRTTELQVVERLHVSQLEGANVIPFIHLLRREQRAGQLIVNFNSAGIPVNAQWVEREKC